MTTTTTDLPCGPGADARYCPTFWEQDAEIKRLRAAVAELLDGSGLDDDEQAEWLERTGISIDDEDESETAS